MRGVRFGARQCVGLSGERRRSHREVLSRRWDVLHGVRRLWCTTGISGGPKQQSATGHETAQRDPTHRL